MARPYNLFYKLYMGESKMMTYAFYDFTSIASGAIYLAQGELLEYIMNRLYSFCKTSFTKNSKNRH